MGMVITPLVIALFLFVWLVLGYWVANLLLYPPRQAITRTPKAVGLPYEEVTFASKDRLQLKGWWIAAAGSVESAACAPTVILLHPLFGNRHGLVAHSQSWPFLVDRDVDLLPVAKTFHQAGYAVLMFDFRGHGESQNGLCTGGFTEDQDVMGAVDYVFARLVDEDSAEKPTEKPVVGIVGYGMGATAAFVAVGREKGGTEVIRVFSGDSAGGSGFVTIPPLSVKYLRFLVAIEPTSLCVLLRSYLRQRAIFLDRLLLPLVDNFCQRRGGYPLTVKPLLRFVREVNVPVFYVRSDSYSHSDDGEAQLIYDALPGSKQLWELKEAAGLIDTYHYVGENPETMLAFAAQQIGIRNAIDQCEIAIDISLSHS